MNKTSAILQSLGFSCGQTEFYFPNKRQAFFVMCYYRKPLQLKYLFKFLISITFLTSCNNEKVDKPIVKEKILNFSLDSLKYVLLTKNFPNEGWDFEKEKEIPIYYDKTFSVWTDNKDSIKNILSTLPNFDNEKEITVQDSLLNEYCPDHENFLYCHFIFNNSIMTVGEYYHGQCMYAMRKLFKLNTIYSLEKIRKHFDKKAVHKQKFNYRLNKQDSIETNLDYNKLLIRQVGNGVRVKDEYQPIYKTEWYYFEKK